MTKPQIISDKNQKSINIKKQLNKKLNSHQFKQNKLVIVIGGDGFMLEILKKNKNSKKQFYGINSGNYGFLMNKFSSENIIKNLVSDGVLVSTPAGSTAYNLSVHGPILSLNSKKLSIAPISPFRPRRWKGKIVGDKLKITITNLNPIKRPISAVADNLEVRNAKSISIQTNNKVKFNLLYDKNRSLQKKIKIEQIRKETS